RLKALVAVMLLVGALAMVFVFKDQILGALKRSGLSEDGVPVRLTVHSNPPTVVTVMPPTGNRNRRPMELGRTPIAEQSGAFVGDTVVLENADRRLRWEQIIEYGEPNAVVLIDKNFKETAVRFKIKPALRDAKIFE